MSGSTLPEVRAPETKDLSAISVVEEVRTLEVTDQETQVRMSGLILELSRRRRMVTDRFLEPKRQADGIKKFLLDMEKAFLNPIVEAEALGQQKTRQYRDEERRRAEELRKKLEEDARQQEQDRILADALEAEKEGDPDEAAAILNDPVTTPVVEVQANIQKVQGTTLRVTWRGEGTDLKALVKQIAGVKTLARPELLGLLQFNGPAINALAKAQQSNMAVDGVDAIREEKEVPTGR